MTRTAPPARRVTKCPAPPRNPPIITAAPAPTSPTATKLASLVAVGEVGAGAAVIIGGFLGGAGHLVTRLAGGAVLVIMTGAFYLAHADWFITQKLFMSEQIFIFALGLYFTIKGNN